jgi:signal transduction histidine kinase
MKDMKLMRWLGKICNYGVSPSQDPQLAKRVILSNKIGLTSALTSFPPVFVHYFLGQLKVAGVLLLLSTFFTLIPCINKAGFVRVSRFCLIIVPCISMLYFAETLGMKVGTHFFIFPLTCLAFVLFKWEERIYILSGAAIAVGVLFFLLSRSDAAGSLALTRSAESILHITFSVLPVALMCSSLLYFLYGNHKAEASLRQSKESLESAHSQLKENQSQLLQSEKMVSLGQLAAGVAHEINNPMGFIVSNVNTLSEYVNTLNSVLAGYQ